ncbi:dihydrodipicolinate synthase family protein [Rhodopirellula sp. JC740]|uniref:Dihydrodipicolinate synthase family protein n=1 Tax=Rhodopirellula halodulae TaxID=2894198 RepID=A0ABS8NIB1_9BACT|nr:dihydrodipicolinate synthase family protein [Rhodopirellula sp. JC740]MCC9643308.1 dihydrodipicolinate synthase family protein [Rhodopirellula sp. JC740]
MSDSNTAIDSSVFRGCIPALMTPCDADRQINLDGLVCKGKEMMAAGMTAVVYCGSMGDWPLLTDQQRQDGVKALCDAGVPVIVGTGAQNTSIAAAHAAHAAEVGAAGLMVIPRVLSRATSPAAQRSHFAAILSAAPKLPAVIYNSPYYGFETKADLFFDLRRDHANLVGFKEFGGAASLSYAGEHITHQSDDVLLMAGVDTQVYHGFVRCGAVGAITGIGNCLPFEVLKYVELCEAAAAGDVQADQFAQELSNSLTVLSTFDEGPDLVLYYKYLLYLLGDADYEFQLNESDALTASQATYAEAQLARFQAWWKQWPGKSYQAN